MSHRPRVLHLVTKLVACGGASKTARLFALHQHQDGSRVAPALAWGALGPGEEQDGDLPADLPQFFLPDLARSISPLRDRRAVSQIRRVVREYRPDILHTHSSKAGALGRIAARAEGVPVAVHHVHGWSFHDAMPAWQRAAYVAVERRMARHCDALLFVAHHDMELAGRLRIGQEGGYHLIRAGIQVDEFPTAGPEGRERARRALGIRNGTFVVGTVAQMRPQKAPLDFIAAARRISERVPDSLFVWVGDGPMRPQVERAAAGNGLAGRLLLLGNRSDVADLYPAFDVFVLSSLWEGLPRTVLEAALVGVPIVATAVPGTAEVVVHRRTGMLAPPGDVDGLAQGVMDLHADGPLREHCRRNAAGVREEFSIRKSVADLEALYLRLLDGKRSRAREEGQGAAHGSQR